MGKIFQADIPGFFENANVSFPGYASNAAAATGVAAYCYAEGKLADASLVPVTSSASTTKSDSVTLVNLGSAGAGTVVMGTLPASSAYASWTPWALSLATVASKLTFAEGDVIGWVHASAAAGTVVPVGNLFLKLQYT